MDPPYYVGYVAGGASRHLAGAADASRAAARRGPGPAAVARMIKVAMVEDHPIVLAGLARIVAALPDVELIATAERIENLPRAPAPDVVLLDLHLPGPLHGLAGVR